MYEGPSVDNHFDKDCISGVYRLTSPGGEVCFDRGGEAAYAMLLLPACYCVGLF